MASIECTTTSAPDPAWGAYSALQTPYRAPSDPAERDQLPLPSDQKHGLDPYMFWGEGHACKLYIPSGTSTMQENLLAAWAPPLDPL